nr:hypothetical protein [Tanacetum cinerariifolium]
MACHSKKDRSFKDYDHSWTSKNLDHEEKMVNDRHSYTNEADEEPVKGEFEDLSRVTRLKTQRYKKIVIDYEPSSVTEIDEFEQEEVAICLMMLSKDTNYWDGVNSVVESSDNNSDGKD